VTTVLICDDQPNVREELRGRLTGIPGVDRVVTCESGQQLLARYGQLSPDLVLVDVAMPLISGVETIRQLLRRHPDAHVLMLTGRTDRESAAAAIAAGARGFLAKEGSPTGFSSAVAGALAGRDLVGARNSLRGVTTNGVTPTLAPVALTERELQVLRGMSQGRSNAEIGRSLYLSEDTVKTHARRLFRKLGVNDRAKAVALGFRQGLVS
jgi:DNA-binding NarL/FixJ family response regulator